MRKPLTRPGAQLEGVCVAKERASHVAVMDFDAELEETARRVEFLAGRASSCLTWHHTRVGCRRKRELQ